MLDAILELLVEEKKGASLDVVLAGFDPATVKNVVRLLWISEHERRPMPPGLILTHEAFGPGRRVPIAQRYPL